MMLADARAMLPELPGPPGRARGRCRVARATSPPGASATPPRSRSIAATTHAGTGRARSGSTSPAAPICSAARRRCAPTCSRASSGRACMPRRDRRQPRRRLGARALRRGRRRDRAAGRRRAALGPLPVAALRLAPELGADAGAPGPRPDRAASIPCRARRWRRASATTSDHAARPGAGRCSPSRSRRARRCPRIAPSWRSPSRSCRPRRCARDPAAAAPALRRPRGGERSARAG